MPSTVPAPSEIRRAFKEELHPEQQTALVAWLAFTVTFIVVRIITHRIKDDTDGKLHNVTIGGIHVHHYLWGILSVSIVGGVALRGDGRRRHPFLAIAYGAGLALIVDEFALLLDLRDVYWAKQGRWSVDLAVTLISSTGSVIVGLPVLRRLLRNRKA